MASGVEISNNGASPAAADKQEVGQVCPRFHAAIELIGKRWTGAIVWALSSGSLRFAELGRAVPGLSDRLLSQRLRELEAAGVVTRRVEEAYPARVSYSLTEKGEALKPAITSLGSWAERWGD